MAGLAQAESISFRLSHLRAGLLRLVWGFARSHGLTFRCQRSPHTPSDKRFETSLIVMPIQRNDGPRIMAQVRGETGFVRQIYRMGVFRPRTFVHVESKTGSDETGEIQVVEMFQSNPGISSLGVRCATDRAIVGIVVSQDSVECKWCGLFGI